MMPIVLVLLAVTSALAAPSLPTASLTAYNINELGIPSNSVERAFELVDQGSVDVYTLLLKQTFVDLINQPDKLSQSLGAAEALITLAYLSTTLPGDSCAATALIDAYVNAVRTGNFSQVRGALSHFIDRVGVALDFLVALVNNPESLRNAKGPGSGCAGGGRSYPFEAAWDAILSSASPYQIGLLNEQYCAAKRLSTSYDARSISISAAVTALALPASTQILQQARQQLTSLLGVVGSGRNPSQAIGAVKQALAYGAARVVL